MEIYGLPQPIDGSETVTIHQVQNGQIAICTMPLSDLAFMLNITSTAWASGLPTSPPSTHGVVWNDNGVVSVS